MTEDEAFTAAIRENPRDDTARLVYADWLDERNDPRGEWLRIHVQLKRLAADDRLYHSFARRRRELEEEIEPAWLKMARQPLWDGAEIRDWREFYDSLVIEPMYGEVVPKPTVAQLDQFEAETGFRLPRSYRDYILVFGPGKLLTDWDIAAPGYGASWFWDLQTMHENMRPEEHWIGHHPEEHWEQVRRCRYFCSKYKDTFGWDPAEVCDPNSHECAVYRIVEDGRVVRVAESFRGFVEDAVLNMLTLPDWDEEELGSPMRFEPATRLPEPGATADGPTVPA